jgi:hypothetical protein
MIARQAPVGADAGMPMQIDKPRRDEAVGGDKPAVHGLRVGLADERDAIILPNDAAVTDQHMGLFIIANDNTPWSLVRIARPRMVCEVSPCQEQLGVSVIVSLGYRGGNRKGEGQALTSTAPVYFPLDAL